MAPRLVYADWLSQRGDPRGAFIHAQIEADQLPRTAPRWPALWARAERLLAAHRDDWLAAFLAAVGQAPGRGLEPVYRRGFIERLTARDAQLVERARAVTPLRLARYHAPPETHGLPGLHVDRRLGSAGGRALLARPWLVELARLTLSESGLGVRNARRMGRLAFTRLTRLGLRGASLGDRGLAAIGDAGWFAGLRRLDLLANGLTADALPVIGGVAPFEALRLASNPALAGRLADLGPMPGLATLDVRSAWHGDDVPWLCGRLARLDTVDLSTPRRSLSAKAIETLADAIGPTLTRLTMGNTRAAGRLHPVIRALPAGLRVLRLRSDSLEDSAIDTLVASAANGLTQLDLNSNRLTDAGVIALARWPGLRHITHLDLGNNRRVGPAGLTALIDARDFDPVVLALDGVAGKPLADALHERFGRAVRALWATADGRLR